MAVILDVEIVRNRMSQLLDRVRAGEEIIVAVDGKPYARLIPPEPASASSGKHGSTIGS
jgi:prevent-host-death family protein